MKKGAAAGARAPKLDVARPSALLATVVLVWATSWPVIKAGVRLCRLWWSNLAKNQAYDYLMRWW